MRKSALTFLCFACTALADTTEIAFFRGILSPANEVPAANFQGGGSATCITYITRDSSGKIISGSVDFIVGIFIGAPTGLTGMHIHKGAAGVNGPITIGTDLGTGGATPAQAGLNLISKQANVLPGSQAGLDTLNDLLQDPSQYYVNLHTTDFPGGAIRAQLNRAAFSVPIAIMTSANQVPPVQGNTASAVGVSISVAAHDPSGKLTSGLIILDSVYKFGKQTTITGFHLHKGQPGSNGPIVFDAGIGSGATSIQTAADGTGHIRQFLEADLSNPAQAEAVEALFNHARDYYLDMHTSEFPDGLIRETVHASEGVRVQVPMAASNVVPPVANSTAAAPVLLLVRTIRGEDGKVKAGSMMFIGSFRFPGRVEFTGLQVHDGAAGVNGPVRIATSTLALPTSPFVSETGFGTIFDFTGVYDEAGLATLNTIVTDPEKVYADLRTTTAPNGAVRGQLGPPITAVPVVTSAGNSANGGMAAPGGLIRIEGTNLTKITSDLGPWFGKTLPTTYNGSHLTIGGKNAPIFFVSPAMITAQVPVDVAAGPQPLIVSNTNGAGASTNLTIAAQSPAVFSGSGGNGAILLQDYTLAGPTNPAKAGDVLLIYATGLGQTSPPMSTGVLLDYPPQRDTAPVTVTIGGQEAKVIYSIASPFAVGLYQIAVTMPSGVAAGTVPVVIRQGSAASAPVNLSVK
jgi:uncharacterized protein (TIGR03437 family)